MRAPTNQNHFSDAYIITLLPITMSQKVNRIFHRMVENCFVNTFLMRGLTNLMPVLFVMRRRL